MKNSLKYDTKQIIRSILFVLFSIIIIISLFYTKTLGLIFVYLIFLINLYNKNNKYELPILFVFIISTNVLEFGSLEQLPYIQLGPGIRFNLLDLIVITFIIFLWNKIINIKTPSSWLINYNFLLTILFIIIGFIIYKTPREAGTNYGRVLIYITFYYVFYFYFTDINRIKRLLFLISIIVLLGTSIQLIEYFLNYRFELPGVVPFSSFYSEKGERIFTAGFERIYLWSRVTIFIFVMTAFGMAFYTINKSTYYLLISLVSIVGFLLALSRIWFLGISLILFVILLTSPKVGKFRIILASILLIVFLNLLQMYSIDLLGFDLFAAITGRLKSASTLGRYYGEMDTFTIRVLMFNENLKGFLSSPLFGLGFGSTIWNKYYNVDLGVINRLVLTGLIGTLPIILFIIGYILRLIKFINKKIDNERKAILVAILAILIGHFPMYIWQIDFWGSNYIFVIVMLLAMGDRIITNFEVK